MKRLFSVALSICLLWLSVFLSETIPIVRASDSKITSDGIIYQISEDSAGEVSMTVVGVENPKTTSAVYIPAEVNGSIVNIDPDTAFNDCVNLESIEVDTNNRFFSSIEGVLFNKEGTSLYRYPMGKSGEYVVPEGTTYINQSAFSGADELTKITLPDSITFVGHWAFRGCTMLEEVEGAVPAKEGTQFVDCHAIKRIVYKLSPEYPEDPVLRNVTLYRCSALEEIVFPNDCMLGGSMTVVGCNSLRELVLPNIELVSQYQFRMTDNTSLKKIIIPQKQTSKMVFLLESPQSDSYEIYGAAENVNLIAACEAAGLKFYPLSPEQTLSAGDVDGNGAIDLLDVITLNKNLLGLQQLDESQQKAADVNADDSLDSSDSLLILRYIVHLEDKLG